MELYWEEVSAETCRNMEAIVLRLTKNRPGYKAQTSAVVLLGRQFLTCHNARSIYFGKFLEKIKVIASIQWFVKY